MTDKLGPFELNEIYLGDCRELLAQLPDKSVDFVFTDPPYGHNNNSNGDMISRVGHIFKNRSKVNDERPIANDGPEANDLVRFTFAEYSRLLKPGSCCCCCGGGGGPDPQFARWSLWLDEQIPFKMMVVWDKGPMGMGHHYRRSYETVLVAQKPGAACKWCADSKDVENVIRPGDYGIRKIIPTADQHPTEKPVELAKFFIDLHTQPGDIILDCFAGRGTTLQAAEEMGRRYIGFEISEKYVEIAKKRLDAVKRQGKLFVP
jgi:DNA modification methylase